MVQGRGTTKCGGAPLLPEVGIGVKARDDARKVWLWRVWGRVEDTGGCHPALLRVWGGLRFMVENTEACRSQGPLPRVTQAASDRVGPKPRPPDRRAPAVSCLPCLPRPWGATTLFLSLWEALGTSARERTLILLQAKGLLCLAAPHSGPAQPPGPAPHIPTAPPPASSRGGRANGARLTRLFPHVLCHAVCAPQGALAPSLWPPKGLTIVPAQGWVDEEAQNGE